MKIIVINRKTKGINMQIVILAILALLLTGCASLAGVSAGHVGCPQEEITISNEQTDWTTKTWTATCGGRSYICTYATTGSSGYGGTTGQVNCSPMGNNGTKANNLSVEQSPEVRLEKLKELLDKGLIDADEYKEKRKAIVGDL
jgi:uncharacterized protein YceK